MAKRSRFTVAGKDIVAKIRQLVSRGDVRRVCPMDEEKSLLEIPFSTRDPASPSAVIEAPVLAAINAFATLVTKCTIEVETKEK